MTTNVAPKQLGVLKMTHPAFLSFVKISSEKYDDLMVTQFGDANGYVVKINDMVSAFANPSTISTLPSTTLGSKYTWPNNAEIVPADVFSQTETAAWCKSSPCKLIVVPDGFLVPGHKTGGVFIQEASAGALFTTVAPVETDWFYHKVLWVDMDGDGLQDILTARCKIGTFGGSSGELIWLKHPSNPSELSKPWKKTKLTDGPDVMAFAKIGTDGLLYVFSAEFFSTRLTLTTISLGTTPLVKSYEIIDKTLGAAYDVFFSDVDGDGVNEMVVSTHDGGSGGFIYAYELPNVLTSSYQSKSIEDVSSFVWNRILLATGFKVTKFGMNQAAPGFMYSAGNIDITTSTGVVKRPSWLVAGDGSEGVHKIWPVANSTNPYAYSSEKILTINGTVGSLAVGDVNHDGIIDFVVPDYDAGKLYFYQL